MKPALVYPESYRRGFVQIIIVAVIALTFGAAAIFGYQKFLKKTPAVDQKTETQASPVASADETANWKTYTNTKYGISFEYPSNFIECGCAFGGPITTKGELLTMPADPNTIRRGTDARFDGIAVYIVSETDFNNFVLAEKSALLKLYNNKGAHDEKVNIGGHSGIELVSYSPFGSNLIYLPLSNGVLVLSTLEVSENHFASLNQILSTFKFTSDKTTNWKTYEDKTLAVSILYPSQWKVLSYETEGGPNFPNKPTAKVSFSNPMSDGTVFISLYPNPQNLSLDDYISMQIKKESDFELANGQNAGNPYILPSGSQISKLPNGLTANLKEKDACDPFYCTTYIISRPKAFYKIYFFEQTDKEIVNKMLTSLKFTN